MEYLSNKFDIYVVIEDDDQRESLKKELENRVADLEVKETDKYNGLALLLTCDSGASTMVNGTAIRWDETYDPSDEETITNFIEWLKMFPLF